MSKIYLNSIENNKDNLALHFSSFLLSSCAFGGFFYAFPSVDGITLFKFIQLFTWLVNQK